MPIFATNPHNMQQKEIDIDLKEFVACEYVLDYAILYAIRRTDFEKLKLTARDFDFSLDSLPTGNPVTAIPLVEVALNKFQVGPENLTREVEANQLHDIAIMAG